ncbi:MAG: PKD domain-containing protein, partial [Cytophagaceae bacterium]|nr:PKD domain-containing protein [Cytophagaceae bacterium]
MGLLKKINFTLVVVMTFCAAKAQNPVLFLVTPGNKVCLGQSIQVTNSPNGLGNGSVTYYFGDGTATTPPDPNPTHTYLTANTFNLRQVLPIFGPPIIDPSTGIPIGYLTDTVPIRVVPNIKLSATYTVCGSGRVNLKIVDDRFDSYDIDFGDGTGVTNAPFDPSGTTTSIHIYSVISTYTVSI